MAYKTGDEVLAYCGSCKMDLRANIVAMEGAKIARVMCRTCKKERSYSSPKGVKDPGATPTLVKRRSTPTETREIKTISVSAAWENAMSENKGKPKITYNIKTTFKPGDIIAHPNFGDGIVMKVLHPNKAEIMFENDIKLLLHSKQ